MTSLQKQLMITPYRNDDILNFDLADMEKYVLHLLEPGKLLKGMSADLFPVSACMYFISNSHIGIFNHEKWMRLASIFVLKFLNSSQLVTAVNQ